MDNHVRVLILLLVSFVTYIHVESRPFPNCLITGLDLLKGKGIKKIKATFDLKSHLVFYRVKFCTQNALCVATKMGKKHNSSNVIKDEKLWLRLVSTIMGYSPLVPYSPTLHEHIYGALNDHFNCNGKYYIIMGKPPSNITKDTSRKKTCLNSGYCSRTCSHFIQESKKCQEIRLQCSFDSSTCAKKQTEANK